MSLAKAFPTIRSHSIGAALLLALFANGTLVRHAGAWSEGGHHLIALLAYDLLPKEKQSRLQRLLSAHPRYADDFVPPKNVEDANRWRAGRAGYWPDIARRQPKYNRPTWHFELGATLTVGKGIRVPDRPWPLPRNADLGSQDLHIAQALELCRRIMADESRPPADRAIAACWIAHLVGDAHQPCHAGSLYVAVAFPTGDRGGNEIATAQGRNLHSLWDGLLGPRFDESDISRRLWEITKDEKLMARGEASAKSLDQRDWLAESRLAATKVTYTAEVLSPVRAVAEGLMDTIPPIWLSEEYLRTAGRMATLRACQAGWRLAAVWGECLPFSDLPLDSR